MSKKERIFKLLEGLNEYQLAENIYEYWEPNENDGVCFIDIKNEEIVYESWFGSSFEREFSDRWFEIFRLKKDCILNVGYDEAIEIVKNKVDYHFYDLDVIEAGLERVIFNYERGLGL